MAIAGRLNVLRAADRQKLEELSGVRGFDGELEHGFFVRAPAQRPDVHGAAMYIDAARLQQRLTDHGARHWAAVHSTAIGDAGPYVVMTYFPHSVESIRGPCGLHAAGGTPRGHVNRRMLYHIMQAVVQGLAELRRHADRAHGNLKASNILLSDDRVNRGTWIVLSDPAPPHTLVRGPAGGTQGPAGGTQGPGGSPAGGALDDAAQLGKLLFELVCGRAYDGQWPIEASPDWSRVGGGWRALCNRLLHPESKRRQAALRALGTQVARLRPNRVLARALVMMTLLALALGGGYVGWKERGRWATPGTRMPADTWSVAEDVAVEPQDPGAPRSLVAEVRQHAARFRRHGWDGPAAYLEDLNRRFAQASQSQKPFDAELQEINEAERALGRIDELVERVRANRRALSAARDPLLETYKTFANAAIAPAVRDSSSLSLTRVAQALETLADDPHWGRVIAFVNKEEYAKLEQDYFLEKSGVHRAFATSGRQVATPRDLEQWLAQATSGKFMQLDPALDPRNQWATPRRIEQLIGQDLKRLSALHAAADQKAVVAGYQTRLENLARQVTALSGKQLPWNNRNRQAIELGVRNVNDGVVALDKEIGQHIARREREVEAERALAALVSESSSAAAPSHAQVRREWEAQRDALLAQARKELLQAPSLRDRSRRLYAVYMTIDEALRQAPAMPDVNVPQAPWGKALADALAKLMQARQAEALAQTLAWVKSSAVEATVEQVRRRLEEQRQTQAQLAADATVLVADARAGQAALDGGYGPDEPTAKGPSARKLVATWKKHDLLENESVRQAIGMLLGHADPPAEREAPELVAALTDQSAPLGVRLDAFGLLGANQAFPAAAPHLRTIVEQAGQLRQTVTQRIAEPARREAISSFIDRSVRDQWLRFAARATAAEDLDAAATTRTAAGVELSSLSPTMSFNVALHALRGALEEGTARRDDLEVLLAKLELVYAALPAPAREQVAKTSLASAAEAFREFLPLRHFEQSGPAALSTPQQPWTVQLDEIAGTVTYRTRLKPPARAETLEIVFKRIEGDAQTPPFYLATRETSVELFMLAAQLTGGWDKLDPLLLAYDAAKADPRPGARSWERPPSAPAGPRGEGNRTPILPTTFWLSAPPPHFPPALAADEAMTLLKDPDGRVSKTLNPSFDHPMQYVSPAAALAMARMLGCDLPTPRQWQLAYKAVGVGSPNLRDRVWKLQWLRAAASETTGHLSPDQGTFDASPSEDAKEKGMVVTPLGTPRVPGAAPAAAPGATSDSSAWTSAALARREPREPQEGDRYFDDGALFFRPTLVRPPQFFNHLVGNVAEIVADEHKCYVIGGSALSAPAPFDEPREIANWRDERRGWSDVGFRLALPAVPWPPQQLLAALKQTPYLAAAASR